MSSKKYSMVLDFLVGFASDKTKLDKLAKETEKIMTGISPEIKFDGEKFKSELKSIAGVFDSLKNDAVGLDKVLSNIDLEIDGTSAKKLFAEIVKNSESLNDIDISKLEEAFNGLNIDELGDVSKSCRTLLMILTQVNLVTKLKKWQTLMKSL